MGYGGTVWPTRAGAAKEDERRKLNEERVQAALTKAKEYVSTLTTLERQALYQVLWAEGCRIPTSLHRELLDIAKKES